MLMYCLYKSAVNHTSARMNEGEELGVFWFFGFVLSFVL